jgi:hypothetical protein
VRVRNEGLVTVDGSRKLSHTATEEM